MMLQNFFAENLLAIEMKKTEILMNKPPTRQQDVVRTL